MKIMKITGNSDCAFHTISNFDGKFVFSFISQLCVETKQIKKKKRIQTNIKINKNTKL